MLPGLQTEMRLTREEFEEMIRPRITETIGALGRAVKSAGLGFEGVDRVLLVGGTSRIPLVAEMVREATGRPVAVDAHPKHSMALGAAFIAEERRLGAVAALAAAPGDTPVAAAALGGAVVTGAAAGDGSAVAGAAVVGDVAAPTGNVTGVSPAASPAVVAVAAAGGDGPPPAAAVPPAAGAGSGRGPALTIAAVGAIALIAILAVGASGMLSGGASPSSSVAAVTSPSASPSAAPSPSASPSVAASASSTVTTPTAAPTAVPAPTPTPTPAGRQARIIGITVVGGTYVVNFQVFGYTPQLPGRHVHFFFNTVSVANAGVPGKGPWKVYAVPNPFTQYKVSDRPPGADQMCILVANPDHSIVPDTGNCVDLPS